MITRAREAAGLEPDQLAERIGQSVTTVRRLENEVTEPSVRQINALVSALPLSAEELLRGMGISLNPPAASRLPQKLVKDLLVCMEDEEASRIVQGVARSLRLALEGSNGTR